MDNGFIYKLCMIDMYMMNWSNTDSHDSRTLLHYHRAQGLNQPLSYFKKFK